MSEDAPNPAAAPPARLIPEGVKCVGYDYDLRGLTVDRVCPECGKPIGETVIVDLVELQNAVWVGKVMGLTYDIIFSYFIAVFTAFAALFGSFILMAATINTARLVRTLRQGPDGLQCRVPRWQEVICWGSLPITAVAVILFIGGDQRFSLSLYSIVFLSGLTSFASVIGDVARVIQTCRRVAMPSRFVPRMGLLFLGYLMFLPWILVALHMGDEPRSHPISVTIILLGVLLVLVFSVFQGIEIGRKREPFVRIIEASLAYHGKTPRSFAFHIGRLLRRWRTGR